MAVVAWPAPVLAAKVALVIGNGAYEPGKTGWSRLRNPVNDARAVAALLRDQIGFDEVILETDVSLERMVDALERFRAALNSGDTAFFYYSGHGAQAGDSNFLVPVTAGAPTSALRLRKDSVDLAEILTLFRDRETALNVVVLDACRNNPLAAGERRFGGAGLRGLERDQLGGETVIGFSAAPGAMAADGEGTLSPYTAALLEELGRPGQHLWQVFGNTTARVRKSTREAPLPQVPWTESSLEREHFLFPGERQAVDNTLLTVLTNPIGARVRIPGSAPYYPGIRLPPGEYPVEISHDGYEVYRGRIAVQGDSTVVHIALRPANSPQVATGNGGMGEETDEPLAGQVSLVHIQVEHYAESLQSFGAAVVFYEYTVKNRNSAAITCNLDNQVTTRQRVITKADVVRLSPGEALGHSGKVEFDADLAFERFHARVRECVAVRGS